MGTVITVGSSKGGVGKTTFTANIGAALATEFEKRVLLVDGNLTGAGLAYHFGINYPKSTVVDFEKADNIAKLIHTHASGIKIIPGQIELLPRVEPEHIAGVVNKFRGDYDIIMIDSAPCIGEDVVVALKSSDKLLAVSTSDIPSATCCAKTMETADKFRKKVLGIVLNRVSGKIYELKNEEVASLSGGRKILSWIPESEEIKKSVALQNPLVLRKPHHPISIEFKRIAAKIIGARYEPTGILHQLKGLLGLHEERETVSRKEWEKAKIVGHVMRKVVDVEKLKSEVAEEVRKELRSGMKEDIKQELMQKLKQRLKEKGLK